MLAHAMRYGRIGKEASRWIHTCIAECISSFQMLSSQTLTKLRVIGKCP